MSASRAEQGPLTLSTNLLYSIFSLTRMHTPGSTLGTSLLTHRDRERERERERERQTRFALPL